MDLQDELSPRRSYIGMIEGMGGGLLALLLLVVLARVMTMETFGELSSARGLLWIAEVIASLGFGALATRVYRAKPSPSNNIKARGLRRIAPLLILTVSGTAFVALVGLHDLIAVHSAVGMLSFIAVLAALPLVCLLTFFASSAAAHGAGVTSNAISQWGIRLLFLAILGLFLLQFGRPLSVMQVAATWGIATALALLALWILVLRVEPRYLRHGGRKYEVPKWLRVGMAFALAAFGSKVMRSGGVVVLGWIHADASAAGRLTAALAISGLLMSATSSLEVIYRPVLVAAIERQDINGVRAVFRRWWRSILLGLLPISVIMIAFAPFFLEMFGRGYSSSYWALVICVVGSMGYGVLRLSINLYQFSGHERTTVIIMSTTAALCVGAMVLLGSIWAEVGVALATMISLNLGSLIVLVLGWRTMRRWEIPVLAQAP